MFEYIKTCSTRKFCQTLFTETFYDTFLCLRFTIFMFEIKTENSQNTTYHV
jgi:hypothetical protein